MLENLGDGKPLVSDGAMGSLLMERGLKAGILPGVHEPRKAGGSGGYRRGLSDAGADILHTNTFGGSGIKLSCLLPGRKSQGD